MLRINYKMIAESPLYTGSDKALGIKSELRKQRVKMTKPVIIESMFADERQRQDALVDILFLLYNHISPDYRISRRKDIWGEFKSRILSAAGSKGKETFLTRYANSFSIPHFDTELFERLEMFNDHEFIYLIREHIDYLILRMRFNREKKNENYSKIKELEAEANKVLDIINIQQDDLFQKDDVEETKKKYEELNEQIRELENQKSGLCFNIDDLKTGSEKLIYKKEFHDTPYFTGNSINGILRRLAMADYLTRIGVSQTFDFAYHTLFTGGVLKIEVKDEVINQARSIVDVGLERLKTKVADAKKSFSSNPGEIHIDKIDELAVICPPLRLFGSALGNTMIESEMIVGNADLICEENNNGDSSLWGLIEDVFYTRKDSSKYERDLEIVNTSQDAHQMKYIMETVIKGAEFTHSFICKSNNELVKAAFYNTLDLFVNYPYIGGKSSRGLGNVNLDELKKQIDYDYVEKYRHHLEENKEQMRRFFSVE